MVRIENLSLFVLHLGVLRYEDVWLSTVSNLVSKKSSDMCIVFLLKMCSVTFSSRVRIHFTWSERWKSKLQRSAAKSVSRLGGSDAAKAVFGLD